MHRRRKQGGKFSLEKFDSLTTEMRQPGKATTLLNEWKICPRINFYGLQLETDIYIEKVPHSLESRMLEIRKIGVSLLSCWFLTKCKEYSTKLQNYYLTD